jgi:uncharacterized membrane protein
MNNEVLIMSNDAIAQPKLLAHKADQPSNPNQILCVEELSVLNDRSNWKGLVQLAGHLIVMGLSGYVWATNFGNWLLAIPALTIYGFSLAAMYARMRSQNCFC